MRVIHERNVEDALHTAMLLFHNVAYEEDSRNGKVMVIPEPVTTVYERPRERVVFDEIRDCNPFLHFFESLWMLSGGQDVRFLEQFSKNMGQFSDDGKTLNGAYGFRWRCHFGKDQLLEVVRLLSRDRKTRRAVMGMWDPREDLFNQGSLDLPCNTQVMFRAYDRTLDMTVVNRSNDAIWGCYGANAVHFSYLHEYVACATGLQIGRYRQVSNNLHLYPAIPVAARMLANAGRTGVHCYGRVQPAPLLMQPQEELFEFEHDLERFMLNPSGVAEWSPRTLFFQTVAIPMYRTWQVRYSPDPSEIEVRAENMCDCDWKLSALQWINRRRAERSLALVQDPILG